MNKDTDRNFLFPARILAETRSGIVTKWLTGFEDGSAAEIVLVERPEKNIVCFSTMVGCPVGCGFCASGIAGLYRRKLASGEMSAMVLLALEKARRPQYPWVLSAMGEGEPAANIDAVVDVFGSMAWMDGIKFAVSTSAPTATLLLRTLDALEEFRKHDGRVPKLQYSLHSGDPAERSRMFRNSHLPPADALETLRRSGYPNIEINITLIEGWNDSIGSADALREVLQKTGPWYVKMNRFNGLDGYPLRSASPATYIALSDILRKSGHQVEYYETDGNDISAACGQLHFRNASAGTLPL